MTAGELSRGHRYLSSLAVLYHRHGATDRALLYGVAAAKLGMWSPSLALTLASLFLKSGEPEQAGAVLSRFDAGERLLNSAPSAREMACASSLMSRVLLRTGDKSGARKHTQRMQEYIRLHGQGSR